MGEMKEQLAANERKLREANAAMQADMESMAKRMEASNSKLAQLADEAGDTKVIPTPSHVLGQGQGTVARAPKHRFSGLANSGCWERMKARHRRCAERAPARAPELLGTRPR